MAPTFFAHPNDFRSWLADHHNDTDELWVGYYKKATGLESITWPQSVDEALCYGWIDGLRRRIDEKSYMIRFTSRRKNSHWSNVNIMRMKALMEEGRVQKAGLETFNKRRIENTGRAAHEQKNIQLDAGYEKKIKANEAAWSWFLKKPPSYRRQCSWWVMSAKKEETRLRRLGILIECCEASVDIPPLRRN